MMRWNRGTMKLPYIKVEVEYREEETGAPGKVSPALIVGFGLHWAWVYLFMFNGQYILFPEADFILSAPYFINGNAAQEKLPLCGIA